MIYALLRAIAGVALRWYYRDIQIEGVERIPRERPLLLVVNHPNALVDALIVAWVVPRRVMITAKSTIFSGPISSALLHGLGVLPLHRASDLAGLPEGAHPSRNHETFRAVREALARRGTVLIFPEGKTPEEPSLAPLRTGAARMALDARAAGVGDLAILPIGLTFERKEALRSRVFVQIGEAILMESWAGAERASAEALTREIEVRLRALTLSYTSVDDATRIIRLATTIAALFDEVPQIGTAHRGFGAEASVARRIAEFTPKLAGADAVLRTRADQIVLRLESIEGVAQRHSILIEDARISIETPEAARFVLRESRVLLLGGPFALWGRVNHWLPFRAARSIAMRNVESASDPAMRTIIAGTVFVSVTYLLQTAAVAWLFGAVWAGVYLVSLPIAADVNFVLSDRVRRAFLRARAFLRFRRDPRLQARLATELDQLRAEIIAFDRALESTTAESVG